VFSGSYGIKFATKLIVYISLTTFGEEEPKNHQTAFSVKGKPAAMQGRKA
jgi:hypothetical protein